MNFCMYCIDYTQGWASGDNHVWLLHRQLVLVHHLWRDQPPNGTPPLPRHGPGALPLGHSSAREDLQGVWDPVQLYDIVWGGVEEAHWVPEEHGERCGEQKEWMITWHVYYIIYTHNKNCLISWQHHFDWTLITLIFFIIVQHSNRIAQLAFQSFHQTIRLLNFHPEVIW